MNVQQDRGTQRRNAPSPFPATVSANGSTIVAKEIDAAPSLERAEQAKYSSSGRHTMSKAIGFAGAVVHTTIPAWFNFGVMVALIFGGCCSNVRKA